MTTAELLVEGVLMLAVAGLGIALNITSVVYFTRLRQQVSSFLKQGLR